MLFKQNAAPAGWTFVAEDNDRALINSSTEADGGQIGGSWTISGWTFGVDGHVLTEAEMPSHFHDITTYTLDAFGHKLRNCNGTPYGTETTSSKGGDNPHNHGFTSSHDASWRPLYVKVITARKD